MTMNYNMLYLITGIKRYPAYTGDTTSENVRFLVPAMSETQAIESLKNSRPGSIDEVTSINHLYEINGELKGFESNNIYEL